MSASGECQPGTRWPHTRQRCPILTSTPDDAAVEANITPIAPRVNTHVSRSTSVSYSAGTSPSEFKGSNSPRRRKGSSVTPDEVANGLRRGHSARRGGSAQRRSTGSRLRAGIYPLSLLAALMVVVVLGKLLSAYLGPRKEPIRFRQSRAAAHAEGPS